MSFTSHLKRSIVLAVVALSPPAPSLRAETDPGGPDPAILGAFAPMRANLADMQARGFFATGLKPEYPSNADCPKANSFFGDTTRGDGSARSPKFYRGYHGGLDIPVPEGTPIVAMAAGTVVHKLEGEGIGGIGIVLQHAPADTGLPVWTYTEYKHLQRLPDLEVGRRVAMGEVIGVSGKTGTAGRHYGPAGHTHLHVTAFFGASDRFVARRLFAPIGGQWMDPLALFRGPPLDSQALRALPDPAKRVAIPYKGSDGRLHPADTKVVWPFVCAARP